MRGSGGRLSASVSGPQPTGDHITSWQHDYEFVPGKWSHTDYNFETPSTSLNTSAPRLPSVDVPQADKYEVYDYPGGYAVKSDGETDARIRQEEREVQHNLVDGASTCRTFTPGHKFTLTTHPDDGCGVGAGQVVPVDVGGALRPASRATTPATPAAPAIAIVSPASSIRCSSARRGARRGR